MNGEQMVNRIKARVTELGLTMAEFYKDCGISSSALSQWRNGVTTPSMASLQNIAVYLGVTLSYLVEGTKKIPDPVKVEDEEFIQLYQAAPQWLKDQVRALLAAAAAGDGAPDVDSTEP